LVEVGMAVANGHLKILESLYHGRHLLRVDDRQGWMLAHSGSAAVDKEDHLSFLHWLE
jgi:hypothetical protein